MAHPSDSSAQQKAESLVRMAISDAVGLSLSKRKVELGAATVEVDAVDDEETVFVEIFARQGELKGGQKGKVAKDALKLITLRQLRGEGRLILAFASEEAARYAIETSWLAQALRTWSVEVAVAEMDDETVQGLQIAQATQTMTNPDVND